MQRVGIGYDFHRLIKGRRLVLGGVDIPSAKGLEGHSDADVLLHAIMDALLGAAGQDDIGQIFPDTDPAYNGISSVQLLENVKVRLEKGGWRVINVDSVVSLQEPKLAPFKNDMRKSIAAGLGIDPENVNVKATTTEGMDSIGRNESAAAHAVVLIER